MFDTKRSLKEIILIGLAWAVILVGFQALVHARYQPEWPDRALSWTLRTTSADHEQDQPKLLGGFMPWAVAWDSEFYLSIALSGYDDPDVRVHYYERRPYSLNYAFMPAYPMAIRALMQPLTLFLDPLSAATLAGVLVSVLGTIAASVSVYFLLRGVTSEGAAKKAAFFLLIFPSSFFMAQVYTEGFFLGAAFGAMALARSGKVLLAGILGGVAVLARPAGIAVAIPLLWPLAELLKRKPVKADLERLVAALVPILVFLAWKASALGRNFDIVESGFFGRIPLEIELSFQSWIQGFGEIFSGDPARAAYYLVELLALLVGVGASVAMIRKVPGEALFGLAVVFASVTSVAPQGLVRYVLACPAIFALAGSLAAKRPVFDKAWTMANLLLFAMLATLFSFGFWVA